MNILYIAASCSPYHGSEDKIGWNVPIESAKINRVFVITREDQRKYIEDYLRRNQNVNVAFHYVDIPKTIKALYSKGIYSIGLNLWHKKALEVAGEICRKENIDIIHQITPVEFRSIGDYGRIPNVKFVCGPIAGGQSVPKVLIGYAKQYITVEWLRIIANEYFRLIYMVTKKLKKCDYLWFANYETQMFLQPCRVDEQRSSIMPDVSITRDKLSDFFEENKQERRVFTFTVVGRLVHLKGHDLLLDAFGRIAPEYEFECRIVGDGVRMQHLKNRCRHENFEKRVVFKGAVPFGEMAKVYQLADVLVFPSFREATGSVILEAMANGLPVVTINKFGGALILDSETGWLYDGNSKEEYIESLKNALLECIQNPEEVKRRGRNARKRAEDFTWEKKMAEYQKIYETLVTDRG